MARQPVRTDSGWSKLFSELVKLLIVGVAGYFLHSLVDHRLNQVNHVHAQLNDVYSPLRAQLETNNRTWDDFAKSRFPDRKSFFDGGARTKQDIEVWRNFMRNTFQPQNQEMSNIISKNVALLVDGRIPIMFKLIIAHTEAYKAVMANWGVSVPNNPSAYTAEDNTTLVNFPDPAKLQHCLDEQIKLLEETRKELENPINGLFNTVPETVPAVCDEGR